MIDETVDTIKINSVENLDPFISKENNARNCMYFADVPEICKNEPCMLGIDEAGRGPVLGPMVYGIAFCPLTCEESLKKMKCADSKQLTEENREEIFNDLTKNTENNIGWAVEIISPNNISSSMLRKSKHSLNEVSMDSAIGLIHKAIEMDVNIAEIYVDTVGPAEKYQQKLLNIFPDFQITVAKKADSIYPIVSAASICAKVVRDHSLKVWKFQEGLSLTFNEFGSGYPGDPVTKTFLKDNIDQVFGYPRLVRFSWATSVNALQHKSIDIEFDEADDESASKQQTSAPSLKSYFKSSKTGTVKHIRHRFFRDRYLDNVTDF